MSKSFFDVLRNVNTFPVPHYVMKLNNIFILIFVTNYLSLFPTTVRELYYIIEFLIRDFYVVEQSSRYNMCLFLEYILFKMLSLSTGYYNT